MGGGETGMAVTCPIALAAKLACNVMRGEPDTPFDDAGD